MKPIHSLIAAPLLFAVGIFAGREVFPKPGEPEARSKPPLSTRGERKIIRVDRSTEDEIKVSPTDIAGLLELVDPYDAFNTSTRLRAALGNLSPGALEGLMIDLKEVDQSNPGFATLRWSLLNHIVAKDPFHALDMILAQDDAQFRTSSINLVMQAAARVNLQAARDTLGLITDPPLKTLARNAITNAPGDHSSSELLSLLEESQGSGSPVYPYFGHNSWNPGYSWGSFSPFYGGYHGGTNSALSKLAKTDLAAAENYARGLTQPYQKQAALTQIASALAQEDPDQALAWAQNLEQSEGREQNISTVISVMATKDPLRAAGLLSEITNVQFRNNAISSIAGNWAQKDPHAAAAWIEQLPASQAKIQAYSTVAYQLGQTDPLAALQLVDKIPGNAARNILPNVLSQWAARDFEAARNWTTSQSDPIKRDLALPYIISSWVQKDPAGAAAFMKKTVSDSPSPNIRSQFSTIGTQWAAIDQQAALQWANGLEDKELAQNAKAGIYQQWGARNPSEAARHLSTLTDSGERSQLLSSIASNWINSDPDAAKSWLSSLPAEDRVTAGASALSTVSHSQPLQAAQLYDQMVNEAGGNEEHLRRFQSQASQIASNWGQHDPTAAAEWAQNISDESAQAGAYQAITSQWVQYAPYEAAEWIDTLPVGKPRDNATESLIQNIQQVDPASAFDWANTIDNADRRFQYIRKTLDTWKASDPDGAREAVASAAVSEEQREQLANRLEN